METIVCLSSPTNSQQILLTIRKILQSPEPRSLNPKLSKTLIIKVAHEQTPVWVITVTWAILKGLGTYIFFQLSYEDSKSKCWKQTLNHCAVVQSLNFFTPWKCSHKHATKRSRQPQSLRWMLLSLDIKENPKYWCNFQCSCCLHCCYKFTESLLWKSRFFFHICMTGSPKCSRKRVCKLASKETS